MGMQYIPALTLGVTSATFATQAAWTSAVPFYGAMVVLSAGISSPSGTQTNISWSSAVYDTTGGIFWSAGNPSAITIPTGVSCVKFAIHARFDPDASGIRRIILSTTVSALFLSSVFLFNQVPLISNATVETDVGYVTCPIFVSPGEKFNLSVRAAGTAGTPSAAIRSWMSVQVLG